MTGLVLTTFDWLPEFPRGFVRDIRVRWALEEAGLPYSVASVPFRDRSPDHFQHQPFGQVPWLADGEITIFESGAAVLHVAQKTDRLLPADPRQRAEVTSWLFAALNSVEAASLPWFILQFVKDGKTSDSGAAIKTFLDKRLTRLEVVLASREWLVGGFSAADIVMVDVLRVINRFDGLNGFPACRRYMAEGEQRPAFKTAYADQMAHFASAQR